MAIQIYTDGSASKNRSGWGVVIVKDGNALCFNGTDFEATNQRMELTAAVKGLEWLFASSIRKEDEDIIVYTDSAYLYNCYVDKWWVNWINNGWKNSKKEPVANQDLWEKLIPYFEQSIITFEKVKAHSGHVYNEWADKLATGVYPSDYVDLTINEKDDKINIELSEILLDFQMKKYPVNETIKRIRKACGCE